ncbi:MAG: polysaccharide biosynthesis tyrosine autokinase [Bauldia sp.]
MSDPSFDWWDGADPTPGGSAGSAGGRHDGRRGVPADGDTRGEEGPGHGHGNGGRGNAAGGDGGRLLSVQSQIVQGPRGGLPAETLTSVPAAVAGEPQADDVGPDLRKYLWLLVKHRWIIVGSVVLFASLGLMVTFLATPIFRASATIQINRDVPKVVDVQRDLQPLDTGGAEFYQTQYELLKSRSLADRVVASLNLEDDAQFLAADAPSPWAKLRRWLFGGKRDSGPVDSVADVAARRKAAADRVLANLGVEPVRASSIVRLSFNSPNPGLASRIANAVGEGFITENLERRFAATAYARKFLEERLQQLKLKLEESERELVAYAAAQHIVSADDKQTLAMTNLTDANAALAKTTTDRLRNALLWEQAEAAEGLGLPQILDSSLITEMRGKRADLAAEYEDKLSFFKPAYPEMRKLKAQIDEIDRQVTAEVALVKESVKANYEASVKEEQSLAAHVEELKAEVTDFRNRNIQSNILQREVDTNRQLYDGLLQRYKEIGVAGGVGTNNVLIVDRAEVPSAAYSPRLSRNLVLSLLLGLMFGGAAAFAREQLDDTFQSPEDLEESLGLPLLGIIPLTKATDDPAQLLAEPHSEIAEAFRSLRTALQFSTATGVPKSLLVTSSRASEGKSTTAVTLARNFAQLGMRVLLIDADLRKPSLHKYLKCGNAAGLTNYLAGAAAPPEIVQETDWSGLTFMASGPLPPNPAELLAGPKMLSLLTIAAEKFDVVIVDGPPIGGLADAPLLASMATGTLMLIDAKGTRRGAAKAALKRLHFARARVVGAVINKLDVSSPGYSYGYGHGYGYGYAYAYGYGGESRLGERRPAELAASKSKRAK